MAKWINCCDKVPEPWTPVLCISASGRMFVGEYFGLSRTGKHCFRNMESNTRTATYWTSLPEPPKVVESLSSTDLDILKAMVESKGVQRHVANKTGIVGASVGYHVNRILKITGKDPRNSMDLKELADKYLG